jgi:hypothetical protein
MPDLFDKDPIPLNRPGDFDIMKWLQGEYHPSKKAHLPPVVDPIIDACLIEMRTKYNVKVRTQDSARRKTETFHDHRLTLPSLCRNSAP